MSTMPQIRSGAIQNVPCDLGISKSKIVHASDGSRACRCRGLAICTRTMSQIHMSTMSQIRSGAIQNVPSDLGIS